MRYLAVEEVRWPLLTRQLFQTENNAFIRSDGTVKNKYVYK